MRTNTVPDYLNLGPIADPAEAAKKRKKKKIIILLTTFFVVVLAISMTALYWFTEQGKPQQRLYRALENALNVKYVNIKTTYHRDGTGNGTDIKTDSVMNLSDSSHVSSESTIDFARQIKRNGVVVDDKYSIRLIKLSELNIFVDSHSGETELSGLDKGKWIASKPIRGTISSRFEEFDTSAMIYGLHTIPTMGNYDNVLRGKIMDTIRSSDMYRAIDVLSRVTDEGSLTGVRIGVDRSVINKLNKMVSSEIGSEAVIEIPELINDTYYEDVILWIDNKDTIVEVNYRNGPNKDQISTTNKTVFTYLDKVNINEPGK